MKKKNSSLWFSILPPMFFLNKKNRCNLNVCTSVLYPVFKIWPFGYINTYYTTVPAHGLVSARACSIFHPFSSVSVLPFYIYELQCFSAALNFDLENAIARSLIYFTCRLIDWSVVQGIEHDSPYRLVYCISRICWVHSSDHCAFSPYFYRKNSPSLAIKNFIYKVFRFSTRYIH
jgi:hypothetical protein